jgi:hypothetical protein
MEKWKEYAVKIAAQLSEMFKEDCENHIDLNDFIVDGNANAFIHALATVAPCTVYNTLCKAEEEHLAFNYIANRLCFQFCNVVKDEKKEEEAG